MRRRRYEKTQKRNPHSLPIRQHVFPNASILRFADGNGRVDLYCLSTSRVRKATPSDAMFYTMRAWDARAEHGYMKKIEDTFQSLASGIIDGSVTKIGTSEKHTIDQFYGLWRMRAEYRDKDTKDIEFKKVTGSKFTKDQEELLEKRRILFFKEGGTMSAHRAHGFEIQIGIDHEVHSLSNVKWGTVRALEGQFLVPDAPITTIIPLTPTLCFCGTEGDVIEDAFILKHNAIEINSYMKQHCREYLFANDLQQCF
jgi:hypothetical protein